MISKSILVDGQDFAIWFDNFRTQNIALFPHTLNHQKYKEVFDDLSKWTGKNEISINEFVGFFCFMYNETGGRFVPLKEFGNESYYNQGGYSTKTAGRGLIQLTSIENYTYVLEKLGYNFNNLSSSQLDKLFLNKKIVYDSTKLYLTSPRLAGNYVKFLNEGRFGDFAATIACGSPTYTCPAYRYKYENRCNALLRALKNKKITNNNSYFSNSYTFYIVLLIIFIVLVVYVYKDIIKKKLIETKNKIDGFTT